MSNFIYMLNMHIFSQILHVKIVLPCSFLFLCFTLPSVNALET
jgi:hypothetical protein